MIWLSGVVRTTQKDNAMTAMLSVVQDQIYTKTIEGAGTADAKEIYTPITKDKVEARFRHKVRQCR